MKERRIISVRIYQAVKFDNANETTFIVKGTQRKDAVKVTIDEAYQGILIENDKDCIFVPFTNVSCIHFECEKYRKVEKQKKAEKVKADKIAKSHRDTVKRPQ